MDIEIAAAGDGFAIVRNLFELYVHDMSAFVGLDVDDEGRFAIPESLVSYWEGPDAAQRYPFVVRAGGKLAGFALVRQMGAGSAAYDMGEFFVLKRYRRSGRVARSHAGCSIGFRGHGRSANCRRIRSRKRSGGEPLTSTRTVRSRRRRNSSRTWAANSSSSDSGRM